jgi:hypothetical protein
MNEQNVFFPKNLIAMARREFTATSDRHSHRFRRHIIRKQSSCRYIRAVHGNRRYLWTNGWYHGQSHVSVGVRLPHHILFLNLSVIMARVRSAYPQSGIFAFCDPDVPCIIPGTYAFLGAAAALR